MQNINDYLIFKAVTPISLEVQVRKGIREGWQPLGGMTFVGVGLQNYQQTMVKYEPERSHPSIFGPQ